MKYIPDPHLEALTANLNAIEIRDRIFQARLELYSCEPESESDLILQSSLHNRNLEYPWEPENLIFQSCIRKVLSQLVSTSYISYPVDNFNTLRDFQFEQYTIQSGILSINNSMELFKYSNDPNHKYYLDNISINSYSIEIDRLKALFWSAINENIYLATCAIYSYNPHQDSDLYGITSANYFFYDYEERKLLFLPFNTVILTPSTAANVQLMRTTMSRNTSKTSTTSLFQHKSIKEYQTLTGWYENPHRIPPESYEPSYGCNYPVYGEPSFHSNERVYIRRMMYGDWIDYKEDGYQWHDGVVFHLSKGDDSYNHVLNLLYCETGKRESALLTISCQSIRICVQNESEGKYVGYEMIGLEFIALLPKFGAFRIGMRNEGFNDMMKRIEEITSAAKPKLPLDPYAHENHENFGQLRLCALQYQRDQKKLGVIWRYDLKDFMLTKFEALSKKENYIIKFTECESDDVLSTENIHRMKLFFNRDKPLDLAVVYEPQPNTSVSAGSTAAVEVICDSQPNTSVSAGSTIAVGVVCDPQPNISVSARSTTTRGSKIRKKRKLSVKVPKSVNTVAQSSSIMSDEFSPIGQISPVDYQQRTSMLSNRAVSSDFFSRSDPQDNSSDAENESVAQSVNSTVMRALFNNTNNNNNDNDNDNEHLSLQLNNSVEDNFNISPMNSPSSNNNELPQFNNNLAHSNLILTSIIDTNSFFK